MTKIIATALLAFIGGAFTQFCIQTPIPEQTQFMQCEFPTEDSCKPDHLGKGKWTLIPDLP